MHRRPAGTVGRCQSGVKSRIARTLTTNPTLESNACAVALAVPSAGGRGRRRFDDLPPAPGQCGLTPRPPVMLDLGLGAALLGLFSAGLNSLREERRYARELVRDG
jgi:hypothetical protein